ncbi:MAG: acetyl-CoA hydrolase/transferase family protein [Melioribacteraceae bacterium]|nr:acetyl-CoA hydrolase/transferase family protein [Melioribacteraceae bacterium]
MALKFITAEEAANFVSNGDVIGFSGFTAAGAAKAIPTAIAQKAKAEHKIGNPFKIGVITGASTGDSLDGELARAEAISFRTPYQSHPDLRKLINAGKADFFDSHLSIVAQNIRYGFYGKLDFAVIEACDVTEDGEIVPTSSVGVSPTICNKANKIIIELNTAHPKELRGMHDIYEPKDPPHRKEIPIYKSNDRIGSDVIKVDPSKIVGIVETNRPDEVGAFSELNETTKQIGKNVADFLAHELRTGRIPKEFLPIQSGVGNIANAVLTALGENESIPAFEMYTEVIQDSVIDMMKAGHVTFASGCSLTVSPPMLKDIYENLDFFHPRLVLRPQEITNHPEVARRIGIISINTAIEVDLFGNVNSTNVLGTTIMNGIGGSGDFTRNAYVSMFTCPSVAKGGAISAIVPMVSHVDHSEHSVQIIVTEQGVADLRNKSPKAKMEAIIENCAHPDYKEQLWDYVKIGGEKHTPQTLAAAFGMHNKFAKTKDMKNVDWREYLHD